MNGSLYKRGQTYYIDYRLNGKRLSREYQHNEEA